MTSVRCWVRSVLTSGLVLFGLFPVVAGTALAQERTHVAGQVQDSSTRNPLPGVRVTVVGTAVGVMTDASGRYALDVPAGRDSLSFARIGYKRVVLGVAPVLNVAMRAQAVELQEVVTTALGIERAQPPLSYAAQPLSGDRLRPVPSTATLSARERTAPAPPVTHTS